MVVAAVAWQELLTAREIAQTLTTQHQAGLGYAQGAAQLLKAQA